MILLDTHALIWWREADARLSQRAQTAIAHEEQAGMIAVSAFSFWEIALLVQRNRLKLSCGVAKWVSLIEALNCTFSFQSIPISPLHPYSSRQAYIGIPPTVSLSPPR